MLDLFEADWKDIWRGSHAVEPVGAVFTRPEIVDLILDLAGYRPEQSRLAALRVIEPGCGDGAFLTEVVRRLIVSERVHRKRLNWRDPALRESVRAVDINDTSLHVARSQIANQLVEAGCPTAVARELADTWTVHGDFLLHSWDTSFDLVVGNPPYVRIEELPRRVLDRYRQLFETTTDRADIYVAFVERGLQLLSPNGALAFICANRFAKNKYGEALRSLIAHQYRVRYYVNLEHTQPFASEVSAYPAIVVVDRQRGRATRALTLDSLDADTLGVARRELLSARPRRHVVSIFREWYKDGAPWITTSRKEHDTIGALHARLPCLEDSAPGTKVSIGVATGADQVYVLSEKADGIEASRQIPLLMSYDIGNASLSWSGHYLVNPFDARDDGSLVRLVEFPGLAAYLDDHVAELKIRHVAKRRPASWYRTIDRIWPRLQHQPKLVIPDIQATATIGVDNGEYYPHHNVYWIASQSWPLLSLKALLRSSIVLQQVRAYSVQMRGGSIRFQAQTLRKIRVPLLRNVPDRLLERLADVATSEVQAEIDAVANEAYSTLTRAD